LFPGFRHFVPWSVRGDGGGGTVACDWLVGGGYSTPIDARVEKCKNCDNVSA